MPDPERPAVDRTRPETPFSTLERGPAAHAADRNRGPSMLQRPRTALARTLALLAGVGLTCDGGFAVVFTAEDGGSLGNVTVDGYAYAELTKDALSRVDPAAAAHRLGVVTLEPQGLTIVVDDIAREALMARAAGVLAASGCTVGDALGRGFGFSFTDSHGATLRATFASVEDGAAIYVGH